MVVNRFRVLEHEDEFAARLEKAAATLAARPGCLGITRGRNVDDPTLWVLVSQWRDVGSYRRSLSAYDVKMDAVPLLSQAIDEPSAFEDAEEDLNEFSARRFD